MKYLTIMLVATFTCACAFAQEMDEPPALPDGEMQIGEEGELPPEPPEWDGELPLEPPEWDGELPPEPPEWDGELPPEPPEFGGESDGATLGEPSYAEVFGLPSDGEMQMGEEGEQLPEPSDMNGELPPEPTQFGGESNGETSGPQSVMMGGQRKGFRGGMRNGSGGRGGRGGMGPAARR